MQSVENAGCRKSGVWKMRSVENEKSLDIDNSHFNFPLPILVTLMGNVENGACVIWKLTNNL